MSNVYRRAAIVVASLDRDAADALLDRMPEDRAQAIRDAIMQLDIDVLRKEEKESAIGEFLVSLRSPDEADETLIGSYPGVASASDTRSPVDTRGEPLCDLLKHDDHMIATSIMHERTSVIAALLGAMPGKRAAGILKLLAADSRAQVLSALNLCVKPHAEAVEVIADRICDRHSNLQPEPTVGMQHHDALRAIFDELDPAERQRMLADIGPRNPMLAQRLSQSSQISPKQNDCYC